MIRAYGSQWRHLKSVNYFLKHAYFLVLSGDHGSRVAELMGMMKKWIVENIDYSAYGFIADRSWGSGIPLAEREHHTDKPNPFTTCAADVMTGA